MRRIDYLVIHCTATPQTTTVESIQSYWKNKLGWRSPGYHFIVLANGAVRNLQPIEQPSNGVAGHNANSIHISYMGGIDATGSGKDTRTPAQKDSIIKLLKDLKIKFPSAKIQGHRDFAGVHKECPSFNAIPEYSWIR